MRLLPQSLPRRERSARTVRLRRYASGRSAALSTERHQKFGRPGDVCEAVALLVDDFPNSPWTEEALNNLASHYIRNDDEDEADRIFRIMAANFPRGRYGERVAWRVGWRAYRQANYREAAEIFERAAAAFPRADNRPGMDLLVGPCPRPAERIEHRG